MLGPALDAIGASIDRETRLDQRRSWGLLSLVVAVVHGVLADHLILVLAGNRTDSGINAGCIEAAVVSGLQAANALAGRGRHYRIRGYYMP